MGGGGEAGKGRRPIKRGFEQEANKEGLMALGALGSAHSVCSEVGSWGVCALTLVTIV